MTWENVLKVESKDLDSTRAEAQKLANSSDKTVYLFHKINGTYWFSNLYDDPIDERTNPSMWSKYEKIEPDKSLETADTLKSDKWAEETDLQGRVKDFKFDLPESLLTEEEKKKRRKKLMRDAFVTAGKNQQVVDDLMAEHEKRKKKGDD
tara:strand:- start:1920 stop:2369 length:450 start_codon:yes stop_codon:yes gene_type:complete